MVPALLYGISLAELALFLGKASKGEGRLYWEHLVLIAISFETITFNWYIFYDRLNFIENSYFSFIIQLISPMAAFIYVANLVVDNNYPEEAADYYFQKHRKRMFLSLVFFVVVNVLTVFYFHSNFLAQLGFMPLTPIAVITINAFYDIKWLRILAYTVKFIQVIAVLLLFK